MGVHLEADAPAGGRGDLAAAAQIERHPVEGMQMGTVDVALGIADDLIRGQPRGAEGPVGVHLPQIEEHLALCRHEQHLRGVERPGIVTGEVEDVRGIRHDQGAEALIVHALTHHHQTLCVLLSGKERRTDIGVALSIRDTEAQLCDVAGAKLRCGHSSSSNLSFLLSTIDGWLCPGRPVRKS